MASLGRLKNYDDNKKRYALLREKGICVICAINPSVTNSGCGGNGGKTIKYCAECRAINLKKKNDSRATLKQEVLSYYGKEGKCICFWKDCIISDPDMLTIDHIENTGSEERKKDRSHAGITLYAILKRTGFPLGFQTLCHNHQWKKEMLRRRGENFSLCARV